MADSYSVNTNGPTLQLTEDQITTLFQTVRSQAYRSSGSGNPEALYSTVLSQYDRFGGKPLLPNHELVGYTFITRPKLNLSTPSLRQDRILSLLDTNDPMSFPFAIRCYLDTWFSQRQDVLALQACPFFNPESPFLIPLSNHLVSISGWPDPVLDTETSSAGFFSEDLTMAKGSNRLNNTTDLTLTFRDIQGGFILALLYMWFRYIELVVRGDVVAYPQDIAARRINYTCSIYRFVMDPSRQFITKWAKATGCFPRSIPLGNVFNFGERENFISSSAQYSIPFIANKVEIWDPIVFRDFNTLSKKFSSTLKLDASDLEYVDIQPTGYNTNQPFEFVTQADNNFIGLPFVDVTTGYNRLQWVCKVGDKTNPYATRLNSITNQIQSTLNSNNQNNNVTTTYA